MKNNLFGPRSFWLPLVSIVLLTMFGQAALFGQSKQPATKRGLTLNVRDFGATGDGKTKDTAAIQQAIDRAHVLGGGEVVVPPGDYLSGAIALRSNTTLRLEKGA